MIERMPETTKNSRDAIWAVIAVVVSVILLYGHTLQVPFYFDDPGAIVENYLLRDLPATLERFFSQRGLTNLTFALNYRSTGWALPPLHLVNIILHAGCGVLVWLLLRQLTGYRWQSLLGALLFVAHPLQTQGVTYVVQRATVLAAGLFLLAFYSYLQARAALVAGYARTSPTYLRPYFGAVLAGACALLAKENTATLPLVLISYDLLFPLPTSRRLWRALCDYLPFFVVPLFLALVTSSAWLPSGAPTRLTVPLSSLAGNDSLHYLFTQFSVLWTYLRFLAFPYGQALEHNFPVVAELVTLQNGLALAGLLAVCGAAWWRRRDYPLLAFAVAWFFLTLAVESSIIPLDPLFEHRLYLPMFGFVLLLVDRCTALLQGKWAVGMLCVLLILWSPLAWRRNALWNSPLAFYQDNQRLAPESERVNKALALLYDAAGQPEMALQVLEKAVWNYPQSYFLFAPLAKHYAAQGQQEKAFALLERGMLEQPRYSELYGAAATLCKDLGDYSRGADYLLQGLAVEGSEKGRLLNALGVLYSDGGAREAAEKTLLASLTWPAEKGDQAVIYLNLAREYYLQERWPEAFSTLQRVLQLTPGDPFVLERLGEVALHLGDLSVARRVAGKLKIADPQAWQRLQSAIDRESGDRS